MSSPPDPEAFRAALLRVVNELLANLEGKHPVLNVSIDADTPLFATNLLDSLSILQLIAVIEELTGQPVPDDLVTMKHFQSIETLTHAFCHEPEPA